MPLQAAKVPQLQQQLDQTRAELHASAGQATAAAADASAAVRRGREAEARLRAVCEECRQLQGQGQRQAAAMAQLQAELQEEKGRHAEARRRFAEQVCGRHGHKTWGRCWCGFEGVQRCTSTSASHCATATTVEWWRPGSCFAEQVCSGRLHSLRLHCLQMSAAHGGHRQTAAQTGTRGPGQQTGADHQLSRAKDGAVAGPHIEIATRGACSLRR